jgi:RNA polymerase sigma factor (sigma-70 family)
VPGSADEAGAAEAEYQPLLFSIAYGMTGSAGDAEDIVQDAFLGLTRARRAGTTITDLKAYLTTAVTRLGINYLSSARVRRETYVGDWLPEPIVEDHCLPLESARTQVAYGWPSAINHLLILNAEPYPGRSTVLLLREAIGF